MCPLLSPDLRSPATTTNHYARDDPTAAPIGGSTGTASHLATAGHPADGVVINDGTGGYTTQTQQQRRATTATTTTATATTTMPQPQHTVPSGATGDGLVVDSNIGGPLGGSKVVGGTGRTNDATSVNPGINIGVSTHQYTAPVGTSGIGGGVADPGVGMAGVVHPTNPIGQYVQGAKPTTNTTYDTHTTTTTK